MIVSHKNIIMKEILLFTLIIFHSIIQLSAQESNIVTDYTIMENHIYLRTKNYDPKDSHIEVYLFEEELSQFKNHIDSVENPIIFLGNEPANGFITGLKKIKKIKNHLAISKPAKKNSFIIYLSNGTITSEHKKTRINIKSRKKSEIRRTIKKPIIYLYPEEKTDVEIKLNFDVKKLFTYPQIQNNTWKVTADKKGNLFDYRTKRNYYSLFWEAESDIELQTGYGNIVSKEELRPFLEESLEQLGLNEKELNEFMIYWLPELEKSEYNFIHFSQKEYAEKFPITITPRPDNFIRVFMTFKPVKDKNLIVKKQTLLPKPKRNGFTAVEWGGMELK